MYALLNLFIADVIGIILTVHPSMKIDVGDQDNRLCAFHEIQARPSEAGCTVYLAIKLIVIFCYCLAIDS